MTNLFAWILFAFPVYLLIKGRLGSYLALAEHASPGSAVQTMESMGTQVPNLGAPAFGPPGATGFMP